MQVTALGNMHVPVVPVPVTTHFEGARHEGPIVGSVLHAALSMASATHVPVVAVGDTFAHRPVWHTAKPVMGSLPISPQGWVAEASEMFWHVPTALPFAVGMQTRPMSALQAGMVFRDPSHAALTAAPEAWHVPIVIVASSSPTHERPDWHGW